MEHISVALEAFRCQLARRIKIHNGKPCGVQVKSVTKEKNPGTKPSPCSCSPCYTRMRSWRPRMPGWSTSGPRTGSPSVGGITRG